MAKRFSMTSDQPRLIHSDILEKGGYFMHKEYTERKVALYSDAILKYWHLATTFRNADGTTNLGKCSLKPGGKGMVLSAAESGKKGGSAFKVVFRRTDSKRSHTVGDDVTLYFRATTHAARNEWLDMLQEAMTFSRQCSIPVRKIIVDRAAMHGEF